MIDNYRMQYEDVPAMTKAEVLDGLARADVEGLQTIALSAALRIADWRWAQGVCLQLTRHSEPVIRGNAILGLGHLARIHRCLDRELVEPAIRSALIDSDEHVRSQADSAADDIATFLGWQLR